MKELTVEQLRESVELVLNNPSYKKSCVAFEGVFPEIWWL